jgi:hypothetical protein
VFKNTDYPIFGQNKAQKAPDSPAGIHGIGMDKHDCNGLQQVLIEENMRGRILNE